MKHYITYFSPLRLCLEPTHVRQSVQASLRLCAHLLAAFTLHCSLTCCHTQRAVQAETYHETNTLRSHIVEAQTFLVDSLFNEMFISADSLSITSSPAAWSPTESGPLPLGGGRGVRIVASGVTFASRKSMIKESKSKVAIEDTTSLHIRDTTFVENKVDKQAVYEPPDIRTFLLFFALLFLVYLVFERR